MEFIYDAFVDLHVPAFASQILNTIESLQKKQNPPFSDGLFWVEIQNEWRARHNGEYLEVLPLFDLLWTRLFKMECIYTNEDCTKYSSEKMDGYFTYKAGIEHKFPGYTFDSNFICKNVSDEEIDL
jgi:hypothetical protein